MSQSSRENTLQEQRNFPRVSRSCDVSFRHVNRDAFEGKTQSDPGTMKNISGGGICFSNQEKIPIGSMLALEVVLPEFPDTVISMGKVCWCKADAATSGFEIGVEFWWIGWKDEAAQQKLRSFITTALREDID